MGYDKIVWHIAHREERSPKEAAYIHYLLGLARLETGVEYRTILDVPCGNGRLHPYLRKLGYNVEGIDISEELVTEARKNGLNRKVGNMADPNAYPDKKYDAILNWFTSFGYLSDEENERTLDIWRKHLKDSGVLIIDVALARKGSFTGAERYNDEMIEIMEDWQEGVRRHVRIRLFRDEGNVMHLLARNDVSLRLYTLDEMAELLKKHGFRVIAALDHMSTTSAKRDSPSATFVAIRDQ